MRQSVVQIWIKQDLGGDTNNFYGAIQDESALNGKLTQTMNARDPRGVGNGVPVAVRKHRPDRSAEQ